MSPMPKPRTSITQAEHAGVYRCNADDSREAIAAAHAERFTTAAMELGGADKATVLDAFASALRFPDWFGGNWDGLADCLTDLSWLEAPGYLLVLRPAPAIAARLGEEDFATLIGILQEAAEFWRDEGRPFCALFEDATSPAFESIPDAIQ